VISSRSEIGLIARPIESLKSKGTATGKAITRTGYDSITLIIEPTIYRVYGNEHGGIEKKHLCVCGNGEGPIETR